MRRRIPVFSALLSCLVIARAAALAAEPAMQAMPAMHGMIAAADIQWKSGPPSLPAGSKIAVLEGDPSQEGIFTMRLSLPDGYKISPHWHPAFEHVTVISGSFNMGMGESFDVSQSREMIAGTFGWMAPGQRHYAWTRGETVIQLHGMGPWQIYYVNPQDDPRNAAKK